MNGIEQIRRYIDKTGIAPKVVDRYCLHQSEIKVLFEEIRKNPFGAMDVIFRFG